MSRHLIHHTICWMFCAMFTSCSPLSLSAPVCADWALSSRTRVICSFTHFALFFSFPDDWQAKKDLSSHCDQIVMSLASLNKQKSLEKQQPQSIKTTVTISKVSRTSIDSVTPVMSQRRQISTESSFDTGSQPSIASNESSQTVREMQKYRNTSVDSVDDPIVQADIIAKRKQLAKEKFLSESSISNGEWIRVLSTVQLVVK